MTVVDPTILSPHERAAQQAEEQWRAATMRERFAMSPSLQTEFGGDVNAYLAFMKYDGGHREMWQRKLAAHREREAMQQGLQGVAR